MSKSTPRFYYKGSKIKQLRAFCQAARLGSITRAAEALFLSQPAVSLQLGALESEFAVKLFDRQGRRLSLTPEGEVLYELALPLVDGLETLEETFRLRLKDQAAGELNIAAGSSTILYFLPLLVEAFRDAHPDIQLKLHNVTGKDGLAMIRSEDVDLAVGSMLDVPSDLEYIPIRHFDPMLITPLDHPLSGVHPLTLEDLSPYGLILPPQRLTTYRLVDLVFKQRRVPYTVALEVGGWEIIKQYVAMGLGISIVTGICITDADHDRLVVRNLRAYFPPRSYGLVLRKGQPLSPQARAFAELVKPDLFA